MLVNWLLYPLILVAACAGHGLLIQRITALRSTLLLLPLGFASVLICSRLAILSPLHGEPWVGLLAPALLGWIVGGRELVAEVRAAPRAGMLPGIAAVGAFLAYGAPVIFLGTLTFSGYTQIVDIAHHFTYTDWLIDHGFSQPRALDSSYAVVANTLVSSFYPLGFNGLLAAGSTLLGRELAWMYQPTVAFAAPMAALVAYGLLRRFGLARGLAALGAFIAAQPTLLYSYGIAGGFKELFGYTLILLTVAVAASIHRPRQALALLVPVLAAQAVFSYTIAPWLAVILATFAVAAAVRLGWARRERLELRGRARWAVPVAVAVVIGGLVAGVQLASNIEIPDVVTSSGDLGNLAAPLDPLVNAGVWLTGDYRYPLESNVTLTHALVVLVLALAALGLVFMAARREVTAIAIAAAAGVALLVVASQTGPWIDAKIFEINGGLTILLAFAGAAALSRWIRPVAGWVAGLVVAGAVLAGNGLAYHSTTIAPGDRFAELVELNQRFAGQGPTLVPFFDEYSEYFLRDLKATGRVNPVGGFFPADELFGSTIEEIDERFLQNFLLLVVRRGPEQARPPENYERIYAGRAYDVWHRVDEPDTILAHLRLPATLRERTPKYCRSLTRQIEATAFGTSLAWARTTRRTALYAADMPRSEGWPEAEGRAVLTRGPGRAEYDFPVGATDRYDVWANGSFQRPVKFSIDGKHVGSVSYEADYPGENFFLGSIDLDFGGHHLTVTRGGGNLRPGNGDDLDNRRFGSVVLVRRGEDTTKLIRTPVGHSEKLCNSRELLSWVEVTR